MAKHTHGDRRSRVCGLTYCRRFAGSWAQRAYFRQPDGPGPTERDSKYLAEEAEFVHGDVREARAVRRALNSMDVVFHMAAAVGVGQSMYEIEHYMGTNTQGMSSAAAGAFHTAKPTR